MFAAFAALTTAFLVTPTPPQHRHATRCSLVALTPTTEEQQPVMEAIGWRTLEGGVKYVEEKVGTGGVVAANDVVSLHYTVSLTSGMELGTSRGRWPLTFARGRHNVPIFTEAIEGMRVGGVRRLSVPASMVPSSQINNVPKDQMGEGLRFEIELIGVETGLTALIPSLLPPGNRRVAIARVLFALSFIPYFLPEDIKPELYRAGDVTAIHAAHEAASNSLWLGGAAAPLDSLFQ
eukprot:1732481-Prymnesium_polylepis.2